MFVLSVQDVDDTHAIIVEKHVKPSTCAYSLPNECACALNANGWTGKSRLYGHAVSI